MTIKQYLADINPGFIDLGTFVLVFHSLFWYRSMRKFFTASLLVLLLSACGLKGPLYLPKEEPPAKSQQPQQPQDIEKKK
jgi:predicted small lipoprotein YifL